jgi:hypothetical protein
MDRSPVLRRFDLLLDLLNGRKILSRVHQHCLSRIIKTISKGVVLIISPFLKSYIAGVATCFIIRTSTADL